MSDQKLDITKLSQEEVSALVGRLRPEQLSKIKAVMGKGSSQPGISDTPDGGMLITLKLSPEVAQGFRNFESYGEDRFELIQRMILEPIQAVALGIAP